MAAFGVAGGSVVALVATAGFVSAGAPAAVFVAPAVLLAAGAAVAWTAPRLAYRYWRYTIGDATLDLRHGVVFRTSSSIPYFRVQHVDVEQGPIERTFGLSRLIVRTASATTDASVPGLATDDAAALRRLILERAGRGDAV